MIIYRGDCDSKGIRHLNQSLMGSDGLYTNMINSGDPYALKKTTLIDSIHKHVLSSWATTHFLSFSKSKTVAEVFAGVYGGNYSCSPGHYLKWSTAVVEIDLSQMSHKGRLTTGIDHYEFNEVSVNHGLFPLNQFRQMNLSSVIQNRRQDNWPLVRNILTIDVHSHLMYMKNMGILVDPLALTYSKNDQEVLVIPIDPFLDGVGNTALIDMGAISKINFYA